MNVYIVLVRNDDDPEPYVHSVYKQEQDARAVVTEIKKKGHESWREEWGVW